MAIKCKCEKSTSIFLYANRFFFIYQIEVGKLPL